MINDYYTRLTITLEQSGGEELSSPNATKSILETDMVDCNVHAWFRIFEQVLRDAGFPDDLIMRGACELAFNEMRSTDNMRKVAREYDLKLIEDINTDVLTAPSSDPLVDLS